MIPSSIRLLLGMIAFAPLAGAATVKTISFTLPEQTMVMDVQPTSGDKTQLTVNRNSLGKDVKLDAGEYQATLPSSGKKAIFTIPKEPGSFFLLVMVTANSPMVILPIPNDTAHFAFGTYNIINALDRAVGVTFDTQKVVLKPGASHVFPMPVLTPPKNLFPVSMQAVWAVDGVNTPKVFCGTLWKASPQRRYITMIYTDPSFSLPCVRSIVDVPAIQEEADR